MLVDVNHAAVAIRAVAIFFPSVAEPYREAAYALGWKYLDGTPWWNEVMEAIG